MNYLNQVIEGDCLEVCKSIPANIVDLIITSPPYAMSRRWDYDSISPKDYPDWFTLRAKEFLRILKPTGTFILNIKEGVVNQERSTYVIETILALKKQGWLWVEEYIWHKKNCFPIKPIYRFKDAWERCLHFTKSRNFKIYPTAVMVPIKDSTKARLKHLGKNDVINYMSRTNSKMALNKLNFIGKDKVYPTNVIYLTVETRNQYHSAVFPVALPEWFIKLFTDPGDLVLDPFAGSGTTGIAAMRLDRNYLLIEKKPEYVKVIKERINREKAKRFSCSVPSSEHKESINDDTQSFVQLDLLVNK